jgi:hypothetical protein
MTKWTRVGESFEFKRNPDGVDIDLGWAWRVERAGFDRRYVRVEVAPGGLRAPDLPSESQNAIRTRGASAVDTFLDYDEPPERLVVSTTGIRPR